ncbi:MAG: hypothetical protein HOY79_49770 [Streptomyces sp.]|nr:hypothetical protein [Streptomyces sp.]
MTETYREIPKGPIDQEPRYTGEMPTKEDQRLILRGWLEVSEVEVGEYDRRIIEWMSGWDWSTFATVTSWIRRAAVVLPPTSDLGMMTDQPTPVETHYAHGYAHAMTSEGVETPRCGARGGVALFGYSVTCPRCLALLAEQTGDGDC